MKKYAFTHLSHSTLLVAMLLAACTSSQQQQQEEVEFSDENENSQEEEISNYQSNNAGNQTANESDAAGDDVAENGANAAEDSPMNNDMQDLEASLMDPEPEVAAPAQQAAVESIPVENVPASDNAAVVPPVEQAPAPAVTEAPAAAPITELHPANATLSWVGYEYDDKASQVRVQIVTKGKPQFTIFQEMNKAKQPELVVRFYETMIRRRMRRDIDASEFRSPVAYVRMRDFNEANDVDVVLTLRDAVQPRMVAKDGSVMLTFTIPERYKGPKPIPGQPYEVAQNLASANLLPTIEADSQQPVEKRASVYNPNPAARVFRNAPADGGSVLPALDTPVPDATVPDALPPSPLDALPEVVPIEGVHVAPADDIKVVSSFGYMQVAQEAAPAPTESVGQEAPEAMQQFSGKRITLDFDGTPLNFVLKALTDGSDMNFLIDPASANTPVTMKLKDVPWDQALKAIMETYGLGMAQVGDNVIRVSRLDQMNEYFGHSRNARRVKSQATPTSVLILRLNYAQAAGIMPHVQRILQSEGDDRFSVNADVRTNSLIVEATPYTLARVKTIVERLDYRTPQVEIVARIVEVTKRLNNFLGVAWGTGVNYDQGRGLGFGSLPYPNSFGSTYSVDPGVAQSVRAGNSTFQIGSINGLFDLDLLLRVEEQKGTAEILQSTKNITLDRQPATISGGNRDIYITPAAAVQISSGAGGGGGASQISTVDNLLTTNVTPNVLADGNIHMQLQISSSLPAPISAGAANSQQTRTMNTNVIVKSGSTVVIGGIHSTSKNEGLYGIPFLMDLPIVGVLFRSKSYSENQSEMLAMITPTILTPAATSSGSDPAGATESASMDVMEQSAPIQEVQQNVGNNANANSNAANNANTNANANAQQNNNVSEWNNGAQATNEQGNNGGNNAEAM